MSNNQSENEKQENEYQLFLRRYGKRISLANLSQQEMYTLSKQQGEEAFLALLEDEEEYIEFCDEYYDLLRERYNACSALMDEEYQRFKTQFKKDHSKYSEDLERAWRKRQSR